MWNSQNLTGMQLSRTARWQFIFSVCNCPMFKSVTLNGCGTFVQYVQQHWAVWLAVTHRHWVRLWPAYCQQRIGDACVWIALSYYTSKMMKMLNSVILLAFSMLFCSFLHVYEIYSVCLHWYLCGDPQSLRAAVFLTPPSTLRHLLLTFSHCFCFSPPCLACLI